MEPAASMNVAVQQRRHITSGGDRAISGSGEGRQRRTSTREKIARMVAEGATNYPSYLKLIYTGDSEEPSSSEDELGGDRRISEPTASSDSGGTRGGGRGRGQGDGGMNTGRRQTAMTAESQSSRDAGNSCQCHLDSKSCFCGL